MNMHELGMNMSWTVHEVTIIVDIKSMKYGPKFPNVMGVARGGFKTQPPVDRRFRPVPPGCYCSKQWQPQGTGRNRQSTGGWVLKPPLGKIYCVLSMNMGMYMPKSHELFLPGNV